ncbi:metabotropic glutamate receptor 5 [Anabrus simplex]|uniref:metabotropic glutamate receptor 5 n=1 Tax=Anabrus simplex TaxID=316456 RepID=UPI0035A36D5C
MWAAAALVAVLVSIYPVTDAFGRASIGLLVDLHKPPDFGVSTFKTQCGPLNTAAVQHVLAARWAAAIINNQSMAQGVQIEIELYDTCGTRDVAMRDVFLAVKNAVDVRRKMPLLGLIGLGSPDVVGETVTTLHAFNIPLILASPRLAEMVTQEGNILTTAPDMSSVVKPMLAVSKRLGAGTVSLISSCPHSIKKFEDTVAELGLYTGRILEISKDSKIVGEKVKRFLEESDNNETVALVLESEEISAVSQYLRGSQFKHTTLIVGTIGLNKNFLKLWKNLFAGGFLIEPHTPELPDFRNYFLEVLKNGLKTDDELIHQYIAEIYNCKWKDMNSSLTNDCRNIHENELSTRLQIDPEVTFVVKAVSAFSAAMLLVQVEHCHGLNMSDCLPNANINLQQEILNVLSQLSFASHHKAPFELQGTSLHVTHEGQLVSNKYAIYQILENGGISGVGWYSDDQGLVLDQNTYSLLHMQENYWKKKHYRKFEADVKSQMDSLPKVTMREFFQKDAMLTTLDDTPVKAIHVSSDSGRIKILTSEGSEVNARRVTPESYITRPWATVIVAMAAVGTFITLFMLVYVLIKICDGTLAGNQSLGIILLLGIITMYASTVLFVLPGSELKCCLRAFIYPLAMSVCYGILIIKVMQLRSLVLLGLGGRISYVNQYIILFFIVLVQVVINIQWFMTNKPQFHIDFEGIPYCYMPRADFLLLHLYNIILVIIAFLYGLSVLKIRRNYKEGQWVTLAAFLTMPVFVVWGVVSSFAPERFDEPTVCIALIVLATILVMVVFIPKMSTISKQSSHFKHKKMHMSDSVTTVFTTFTDLHNSHRKKTCLSHPTPSMLDAYSDNITKNPIYEVTNGAYP